MEISTASLYALRRNLEAKHKRQTLTLEQTAQELEAIEAMITAAEATKKSTTKRS